MDGEGLFASLKSQKKQSNIIKQENPIEPTFGMQTNGWDGTPLPLTQTFTGNPYIDKQNFGLPQTHTKAPWDNPSEEDMFPTTNNNSQRNNYTFPNENPINNQNWIPEVTTSVPLPNPTQSYQTYDEPPASMYSMANTPQPTNEFLDEYGNINVDPYTQRINQLNQQPYYPNIQPNTQNQTSYFDSMYQQSIVQPQNQGYDPSGLNPFGENVAGYGATGIEIQNPNDHTVIDKVANLQYINAGKNNVVPGSSQYGLCDVSRSEWTKQNIFLSLPIINIIYVLYIGYFQSFTIYPTLKEWARGAMFGAVLINIAWVMALYALFLLL